MVQLNLDPYRSQVISMKRRGFTIPEIAQWLDEEKNLSVSKQTITRRLLKWKTDANGTATRASADVRYEADHIVQGSSALASFKPSLIELYQQGLTFEQLSRWLRERNGVTSSLGGVFKQFLEWNVSLRPDSIPRDKRTWQSIISELSKDKTGPKTAKKRKLPEDETDDDLEIVGQSSRKRLKRARTSELFKDARTIQDNVTESPALGFEESQSSNAENGHDFIDDEDEAPFDFDDEEGEFLLDDAASGFLPEGHPGDEQADNSEVDEEYARDDEEDDQQEESMEDEFRLDESVETEERGHAGLRRSQRTAARKVHFSPPLPQLSFGSSPAVSLDDAPRSKGTSPQVHFVRRETATINHVSEELIVGSRSWAKHQLTMMGDLKKLKAQMETLTSTADGHSSTSDRLKQVEEDNNALRLSLATLQAERAALADSKKVTVAQQKRIERLEADNSALKRDIEKLLDKRNTSLALDARLTALETTTATTRTALSSLATYSGARETNVKITERLGTLELNGKILDQRIDTLSSQYRMCNDIESRVGRLELERTEERFNTGDLRAFNLRLRKVEQEGIDSKAELERVANTSMELKDTVERVQIDLDDTNERLDHTNERLDHTNERLDNVSAELQHTANIAENAAAMKEVVDKLDLRHSGINQKLGQLPVMDAKISAINKRLASIEGSNRISSDYDSLKERLNQLPAMQQKISTLFEKSASIDSLKRLGSLHDTLKKRFDEFSTARKNDSSPAAAVAPTESLEKLNAEINSLRKQLDEVSVTTQTFVPLAKRTEKLELDDTVLRDELQSIASKMKQIADLDQRMTKLGQDNGAFRRLLEGAAEMMDDHGKKIEEHEVQLELVLAAVLGKEGEQSA